MPNGDGREVICRRIPLALLCKVFVVMLFPCFKKLYNLKINRCPWRKSAVVSC
jgi:hypothetical protein